MEGEVRKGGKLESRPEIQVLCVYSVAAAVMYFLDLVSLEF